jgi:hypothetical protein
VHSGGSTTSFAVDPGKAIGADAADNFYITGDYTGTGIFDGLSVPNTGTSGTDIFIAKYNTTGAIQWLHHAGGPASDKGYSIGVDQSGNSWVSGFAGMDRAWSLIQSLFLHWVTNISSSPIRSGRRGAVC